MCHARMEPLMVIPAGGDCQTQIHSTSVDKIKRLNFEHNKILSVVDYIETLTSRHSLSSSKHFYEHYSVVICHFHGMPQPVPSVFDALMYVSDEEILIISQNKQQIFRFNVKWLESRFFPCVAPSPSSAAYTILDSEQWLMISVFIINYEVNQ